jgi:ABC-type transport system involved in cytochrome bd biosynthesis fused ATPase/permease subunit
VRTAIWWHATRNGRLVHERLDTRFVRKTLLYNVFILLGFAVSIVLAFFGPTEAEILWVIIIVAALATRAQLYQQP